MQHQSPLAPNDLQNTSEYVIVAGAAELHDRSPFHVNHTRREIWMTDSVIQGATRASNANFARARVDGCQLPPSPLAIARFLLCLNDPPSLRRNGTNLSQGRSPALARFEPFGSFTCRNSERRSLAGGNASTGVHEHNGERHADWRTDEDQEPATPGDWHRS
jgi:hypothetical protein